MSYVFGTREVNWPVMVGTIPAPAHHFQHRPGEEEWLARVSEDTQNMVLGQVLSGMGGVGKTQLAAHHARVLEEQAQVDLVLWVPAGQRASILAAYAQAAQALLSGQVSQEPEQAAAQFLGWLHTTDKRWLVVLDNLDDPQQIHSLWPPARTSRARAEQAPPWWQRLLPKGLRKNEESVVSGRVVVTTRRADLLLPGSDRALIKVGLFSPQQSLDYLTRALNKPGLSPTEEHRAQLAEELGHLPLALSHAAAYIQAQNGLLDCIGYLERFRDRRRALHRNFPEDNLPEDYPWTVAATWEMSIEHANTLAPQSLAQPLMRFIALLDPAGIPLPVLASTPIREYLDNCVTREEALPAEDVVDALSVLQRLNLISIEKVDAPDDIAQGTEGLVMVHRMVQRATRDHHSTRPDRGLCVATGDALVSVWPDTVHATGFGQLLRSNTNALTENQQEFLWEPDIHPVLLKAGQSIGKSGDVQSAITYWMDLLELASDLYGEKHPTTFAIRANLASWIGASGNLNGAVGELERLLSEKSDIFGFHHVESLSTRNNLAIWRAQTGDLEGALNELVALLGDQAIILGQDHEVTLITRGNIALWIGESGDHVRSIELLEELLEDRINILGPDHPGNLFTRNNIATLRADIGDFSGALGDYQNLLEDQERILGTEHPEILISRGNLAYCHVYMGNFAEAFYSYESLLEDQERILGTEHPDVFISRGNLADCRARSGDYSGAVEEFTKLKNDLERILGKDHPDTLMARSNLLTWKSELSGSVGNDEKSELLRDFEKTFGPEHPRTLTVKGNAAYVQGLLGDPAGAVQVLAQVIEKQKATLGFDHPETLTMRNRIAYWQAKSGDYLSAVEGSIELLHDQIRVLGLGHHDTISTRSNLARWRAEIGDIPEAIHDLETLLSDIIPTKKPDDVDVLKIRDNLNYLKQHLKDAEGEVF